MRGRWLSCLKEQERRRDEGYHVYTPPTYDFQHQLQFKQQVQQRKIDNLGKEFQEGVDEIKEGIHLLMEIRRKKMDEEEVARKELLNQVQ